jgi:small subunit ribosomal protein S17
VSEQLKRTEKEKKTRPLVGVVSSDKMAKSRVAEIERNTKHPQYGKYIKRASKVMFHDEQNDSKIGDKVLIKPSRPRSSRKCFELVSILEKAAE